MGPLYLQVPGEEKSDLLLRQDNDGYSALIWACRKNGQTDLLSLLLNSVKTCGRDVMEKALKQQDKDNRTVLHHACHRNPAEMALALLKCLRDCNPEVIKGVLLEQDRFAATPLILACRRGSETEVVSSALELLQGCGDDALEEGLLQEETDHRTALVYASWNHDHNTVSTLLSYLKVCGEDVLKKAILIPGSDHESNALLHACMRGHTQIVSILLDSIKEFYDDDIKDVLSATNIANQTALDCAISGHYKLSILLISLVAIRYRDTYTKLKLLVHTRQDTDRNPFADVDSEAWEFILRNILNRMKGTEEEMAILQDRIKEIEQLRRRAGGNVDQTIWNDEIEELEESLEEKEEDLERDRELLIYLPLLCGEKNKFGLSAYHYEELLPLHVEILDRCRRENIDSHPKSDIFPGLESLANKFKKLNLNSHRYNTLSEGHPALNTFPSFGRTLSEMFPSFYHHQEEQVPYEKAYPAHPLTAIAESNHLSLIKHPYIATYVNACWVSSARYIFYTNVALYLLYLIFTVTFFTTHTFDVHGSATFTKLNLNHNTTNETDLPNAEWLTVNQSVDELKDLIGSQNGEVDLVSKVPVLTECSRFGAIILSIVGLLFEALQISTKRKYYLKQLENVTDVFLFISTLLTLTLTLANTYDKYIHGFGCILIVCAGLRGAWMFTHLHFMKIGSGFSMLFGVFGKVIQFSPILAFFIMLFSVVHSNLLQNQEPFTHIGFSLMKTMAMTVGELDFTDTFFYDSNNETFKIVAFLIFVLFLAIMTISMMNLLIGLAVPDVDALSKQGEQADFTSKVDLILQYSYMMPCISRKIHELPLCEAFKWGKWIDGVTPEWFRKDPKPEEKNNDVILEKYTKYMLNLDKNYSEHTCKMNPETDMVVNMLEDTLEKNDLLAILNKDMKEQMKVLTKENTVIKEQINTTAEQNKFMKEQIDELVKHNENTQKQISVLAEQNAFITQQNTEIKGQNKEIKEQSKALKKQLNMVTKQNDNIAKQNEEMAELVSKFISKLDT